MALAKLYADLIEMEAKKYKDVPAFLKSVVKQELEARGNGNLAQ